MTRIWALASITFREGIRNRSVYGILLFALFILGLNVAVAGFFMRDVGKVTVDMNLSALTFGGLLLVFFVGLNLLAKDIDRKTVQLVLSKPISRFEYILGKFLGIELFVLASLAILLLLSSATVLLLKSIYPGYFGAFSWGIFYLACFFIFVQLSVLNAVVLFFSAITTSSFITLIFSISVYIVGVTIEEVVFYLHSHFAAQELEISESLSRVIDAVSYLVPNFSALDYKLEAAHGLSVAGARVAATFGYAGFYTALLLVLAALIFRRREFN